MAQNDEVAEFQSITTAARVSLEPRRTMQLMFGKRREGQFVRLRADGLRSRAAREERIKQKTDKEQESVINEIIESVVNGGESSSNSNEVAQEEARSVPDQLQTSRYSIGTQQYHSPKKYHGASTMVEHKKRWTYQMASDINAAEQSEDGEMYYIAHPFLPMPRSRRNGIDTAARMNFAAQRLDNRKFRGQVRAVNEIQNHESVKCEKCGMCYFFESLQMQERISYLQPPNEEDLPTVLFDCPVCKVTTRADVF